jgi:hypothetical protein
MLGAGAHGKQGMTFCREVRTITAASRPAPAQPRHDLPCATSSRLTLAQPRHDLPLRNLVTTCPRPPSSRRTLARLRRRRWRWRLCRGGLGGLAGRGVPRLACHRLSLGLA